MHLSSMDIEGTAVSAVNTWVGQLFTSLNEGAYDTPLRAVHVLPAPGQQRKLLGLMPSVVRDSCLDTAYFGCKCLSVFAGVGTSRPSHQGVYVLFSGADGRVLCTLDAAALTALRTASASAIAAKLLLSPTVNPGQSLRIGIIGTGEQARRHTVALLSAFANTTTPVSDIMVFGRDAGRTQACVHDIRVATCGQVTCHAAQTVRELSTYADVICTVTSSVTPVIKFTDLSDRLPTQPLLLIAVGACTPNAREIDADLVSAAQRPYIVDTLEGAANEAGDLRAAGVHAGVGDMQPLSDIASGRPRRRCGKSPITLYKSVGFGALDLACAVQLYQRARV